MTVSPTQDSTVLQRQVMRGADSKRLSPHRYIDEEGKLRGLLPATPPFYQLARQSWRKLKTSCTAEQPKCPAGVSELDAEPKADPAYEAQGAKGSESSLRLLTRAAMTPLGVFNDHIDYKALLRQEA